MFLAEVVVGRGLTATALARAGMPREQVPLQRRPLEDGPTGSVLEDVAGLKVLVVQA